MSIYGHLRQATINGSPQVGTENSLHEDLVDIRERDRHVRDKMKRPEIKVCGVEYSKEIRELEHGCCKTENRPAIICDTNMITDLNNLLFCSEWTGNTLGRLKSVCYSIRVGALNITDAGAHMGQGNYLPNRNKEYLSFFRGLYTRILEIEAAIQDKKAGWQAPLAMIKVQVVNPNGPNNENITRANMVVKYEHKFAVERIRKAVLNGSIWHMVQRGRANEEDIQDALYTFFRYWNHTYHSQPDGKKPREVVEIGNIEPDMNCRGDYLTLAFAAARVMEYIVDYLNISSRR